MKKKSENNESKRRAKYGMLSCVAYILKKMWQIDRLLFLACIINIPVTILMTALDTVMPSIIVGELEASSSLSVLMLSVVSMYLCRMLLKFLKNICNAKNEDAGHFIVLQLDYDMQKKLLDMDAFLPLNHEVQKLMDRATEANQSNHTDGVHLVGRFCEFIINVLSFLLFGTVVVTLNPWLILLVAVGTAINAFMSVWSTNKQHKRRDIMNLIYRKFMYFSRVSGNFDYGKEMRLYKMDKFINRLNDGLIEDGLKERKKSYSYSNTASIVNLINVMIRNGITYFYLIYAVLNKNLSVAEFTLYFAAVTSLSDFLMKIVTKWSNIYKGALAVSDYREFLDLKDTLNRGAGLKLDKSAPPTIEFRNVTFKYPASEQNMEKPERNIIENLSFTIKSGEKVALVGLNGAGKTTIAKLICGLLVPDEGEIFINGHTAFEYNRDELYSMFGLLPQESYFMPVSIAENIALLETDKIDMERLNECIALSGLSEKIDALPQKVFTMLDKKVNHDAIELSGGEKQKFLLARAIYHGSHMLILDEPTAALDPIAEDRLYQQYQHFTQNCTTLFISHRLSSTRFCDRILLLDGARFAEEGSHDELMQLGGKYKELFDVQSHYYNEEVN